MEVQEHTTQENLSDFIQPLGAVRWSHKSTPKLDAAMAAAQGEMRAAEENSVNPHLNSRYADLNSVIRACRAPLANHGVARYQPVFTDPEGRVIITTRLACDGEWMEADFVCNIEAMKGLRNIQSVGNIITYVKRYTLAAAVGIATGEDDDGQAEAPTETDAPKDRWSEAVKAFDSLNVDEATLRALVGHVSPVDVDHEKLGRLYQGLKAGNQNALQAVANARAPQ